MPGSAKLNFYYNSKQYFELKKRIFTFLVVNPTRHDTRILVQNLSRFAAHLKERVTKRICSQNAYDMSFSTHHANISTLTQPPSDGFLPYLKSGTSVNNGFDENPKIGSGLPRFVAF